MLVLGDLVALFVLLRPSLGHLRIDLGLVGHRVDLFMRREASDNLKAQLAVPGWQTAPDFTTLAALIWP